MLSPEPPRRLVEYLTPWSGSPLVTFGVRDKTTVFELFENFIRRTGSVGLGYRVAFPPRDVALPIEPFNDLTDRLTAVAPRLKYPHKRDRILSLYLCDESEEKLQFFIQRYSGQPERSEPGEEHSHHNLIEYASSRGWHPSPASVTPLGFKAYQERYPIYNGRPVHRTGPPITIYEEVFADIVDDLTCLADRPDNEDVLAQVGELAIASLNIYGSTSERGGAIFPLIESLFDVQLDECFPAFTSSEDIGCAASVEEIGAVYLHADVRNELGLGGITDLQGPLMALKHIVEPDHAVIRNRTCCPCIHISISGPYISFGGSILTDIYSHQLFTDYIYLGGDPFMTGKIHNIAKIFDIFRIGVSKLREKYEATKNFDSSTALDVDVAIRPLDKTQKRHKRICDLTRDHLRLFPRPSYLPNTPIPNLVFQTRFIPSENHQVARLVLFHAKLDGHPVIAKFSERYNPDAHRAVAEAGFAPRLHFHARLRGGMHMVIMDVTNVSDAHEEFGTGELPDGVVEKVKAALAVLHNKNLVHGDVRRPNILVKRCTGIITGSKSQVAVDVDMAWQVYLADFGHVGEANKDRYPLFLDNRIRWSLGVRPSALMQMVHDNTMLEKIIHIDM